MFLDRAMENNENQTIGYDDNENDMTEELDYDHVTQTRPSCKCGTERTDEDLDYIVGGQAVKIVSFIRHFLFM